MELRAQLKETLDRIAPAAGEACRTVMQEHLAVVDQAVDEFLRDYSYPDRLVRRLKEAKTEFPKLFASRVTEALKTITQETRDALR